MTEQLALVGRTVGEVGDPLDRHFTPDALAEIIVRELDERVYRAGYAKVGRPRSIVEPSVGGGAFARAARKVWPGAHIIGVDIDPDAEGRAHVDEFVEGDWTCCREWPHVDLSLGNPPFSGTTAIPHVETAREVAEVTCFILPWSPLGGVWAWRDLMDAPGRPMFAWPFAPRPWGDKVRETAAYVWLGEQRETRVRWLEKWK